MPLNAHAQGGAEHLAGQTLSLGDKHTAIWCPKDVVRGGGQESPGAGIAFGYEPNLTFP